VAVIDAIPNLTPDLRASVIAELEVFIHAQTRRALLSVDAPEGRRVTDLARGRRMVGERAALKPECSSTTESICTQQGPPDGGPVLVNVRSFLRVSIRSKRNLGER
jgi:hypothetical protein